MSNTIQALFEQGQSAWCDNISRDMIDGGELQRLIDLGVVGVTSNPTIFMKAITGGTAYDGRFAGLLDAGHDPMGIYEGLVLPDIADAADILRPVHDRTGGIDGFVSLEVNPKLAYDTDGTIAEARRLHGQLNRPNVLIKVPATAEGIPAIETLIGEGISVNVTLIFSIEMHRQVMSAYLSGLERLDRSGGDVSKVASVASFFVSRVDAVIDKKLAELQASGTRTDHLLGKAAIANARIAYAAFRKTFEGSSTFDRLSAKGARVQRPLWASTSTKNPDYSDTMYVDELIGPHTVNTLPPATLDAMLDHGKTAPTIENDIAAAQAVLNELRDLGVDLGEVTDQLITEGVELFARSFDELLANLAAKGERVRAAG